MTDKTRPPGFLNRWSARKQQADHEQNSARVGVVDKRVADPLPLQEYVADTEPDNVSAPTTATPSPAANSTDVYQTTDVVGTFSEAAKTDNPDPEETPLLSDADMPPIESLTSESNLSCFFNKGVSATLKKAALRHVFMQPKYNVRDGLNDYDGDYTSFEPLGDTITSDMKWHTARKERARLEAEARELEALEEQRARQEAEDHVQDEQVAADNESAGNEPADNESEELQNQEEVSNDNAQAEEAAKDKVPDSKGQADKKHQLIADESSRDECEDKLQPAQATLTDKMFANTGNAIPVSDSAHALDTRQTDQTSLTAQAQRVSKGKLTRVSNHTDHHEDQVLKRREAEQLSTTDTQESPE